MFDLMEGASATFRPKSQFGSGFPNYLKKNIRFVIASFPRSCNQGLALHKGLLLSLLPRWTAGGLGSNMSVNYSAFDCQ